MICLLHMGKVMLLGHLPMNTSVAKPETQLSEARLTAEHMARISSHCRGHGILPLLRLFK